MDAKVQSSTLYLGRDSGANGEVLKIPFPFSQRPASDFIKPL